MREMTQWKREGKENKSKWSEEENSACAHAQLRIGYITQKESDNDVAATSSIQDILLMGEILPNICVLSRSRWNKSLPHFVLGFQRKLTREMSGFCVWLLGCNWCAVYTVLHCLNWVKNGCRTAPIVILSIFSKQTKQSISCYLPLHFFKIFLLLCIPTNCFLLLSYRFLSVR